MELLKQTPDNYYGLCIVDPPYGMDFSSYQRGGGSDKTRDRHTQNGKKKWDAAIPSAEYFEELMRVSTHQIVWGGNYFPLPPTQGFIFWYKRNPVPNFSDGELAWTSFQRPAMCFDFKYYGGIEGNTSKGELFHPTQKPVALYRWLLKNYAKPGQRILDTHGGSMSIAIACDIEGFDLTLCEIDPDYFQAGKKRLEQHQSQPRMFDAPKPDPPQQLTIDPAA